MINDIWRQTPILHLPNAWPEYGIPLKLPGALRGGRSNGSFNGARRLPETLDAGAPSIAFAGVG
jgi:hypothetical protein